jgi:hypothetical protein
MATEFSGDGTVNASRNIPSYILEDVRKMYLNAVISFH